MTMIVQRQRTESLDQPILPMNVRLQDSDLLSQPTDLSLQKFDLFYVPSAAVFFRNDVVVAV